MLQNLIGLVRLTLAEPRNAAKYLMKNAPDGAVMIEGAIVAVALGTIMSVVVSPLYGTPEIPLVAALLQNPLLFAIVDLMALMISVIAVHIIGRMFGGTGEFDQALILVVWLQILMLLIQVALLIVLLVSPRLAEMLTAVANFYLIWLLINFVAILHGFHSRLKVFVGFIAASIALSFVIIFLLALLGIGIEGA